jgi:hypothetical protein
MKSFLLTCALATVALLGVSMAATNADAEPGSDRATGTPGATTDVIDKVILP